jgi:hypothetical protein
VGDESRDRIAGGGEVDLIELLSKLFYEGLSSKLF